MVKVRLGYRLFYLRHASTNGGADSPMLPFCGDDPLWRLPRERRQNLPDIIETASPGAVGGTLSTLEGKPGVLECFFDVPTVLFEGPPLEI